MSTPERPDPAVSIHDRLKAFLAAPNFADDDGWPNITAAERVEFIDMMYEIARLKWGEDCDGDQPVKLRLIDRKKEDLVFDLPLRSTFRINNFAQRRAAEMENLRLATIAIEAYGSRQQMILNELVHLEEEERRAAERRAARQAPSK